MINFEKVAKARALFKERGAIRREYIRDEIAYSWVRSRLYSRKKVEFLEEDTCILIDKIEYSPDEIVSFIDENINKSKVKYAIFIVGEDGKLKSRVYKNTKTSIKIPNSFREEHIGTNGIGITFSLKKSLLVYGSEHYSQDFDDYISSSILDLPFEIEKGVLGLIAEKEDFDSVIIDEIKSLNYNLLVENKGKDTQNNEVNADIKKLSKREKTEKVIDISQEIKPKMSEIIDNIDYSKVKIPYCLIGNSKEKLNLKTLVMTKALGSPLINIYGEKGSGREYLARFIHENSNRNNYRFIRINPRIDISYVMEREIEEFQNGTLYIENINELSSTIKSKILRKINCKLVNSVADEACNKSDVAFLISNEVNLEDGVFEEILLTSLKLKIDSVRECEDDLQLVVSKLIEEKLKATKNIKNLEMFSPIYIHGKSKEISRELLLSPLLSYRNLKSTFDKVISVTSKSIEVNRLKVDKEDKVESKEFKKLKELELDYIREVMNYTNDNIAKASEILGIGRTTIYRKLKNE